MLQNKFSKIMIAVLIAILFMVLPIEARADSGVINPNNGNAWVIYVYGNARVIQDLFMAVKLMVNPDSGQTFFITLMYLIATVGFFVLAVAAGFDPGKNFMRMFTYILVVWAVMFSTTKLSANVIVIDKLNPPIDGITTVSKVPAIIVIPASLISQVGEYFAKSVDTYFTVPGFELSKVGQFNLFSTMAKDAMSYRITDSNIRKTMSMYTNDCVIPAMATNRFSGPGKIPSPTKSNSMVKFGTDSVPTTETTLYGIEALRGSTDLLAAYSTAASPALFTRYYPAAATNVSSAAAAASGASGPSDAWSTRLVSAGISATEVQSMGITGTGPDFGVVVTCQNAYLALKADITDHAQVLLGKSSEQWGAAGGNIAYSSMFSSMLASASSNETADSFIRQKAFLSQMGGSFRGAATQAGNSDVLQTLAIEQAEQQQKSMMVSAFEVFNNMMGYMYTVLQAFMYGMAPIIILAMLVPGLGKNILVNYMQVLIWLALWAPLLGIVNYIITLFAQYDISKAFWVAGGGINSYNDALITEKSNNMIIAGQFLGTLVPMISWGIIKGAMAFTEFINHGVGSQFAAQAGATAATGNYSLNNASADNLSMNKFSTTYSTGMGFEAVKPVHGAGAALPVHQGGGETVTGAGGGAWNGQQQLSQSLDKKIESSKAVEQTFSAARAMGLNAADVYNLAKNEGFGRNSAMIAQTAAAIMKQSGTTEQDGVTYGLNKTQQAQLSEILQKGNSAEFSAGGKLSFGKDSPLSVDAGLRTAVTRAIQASGGTMTQNSSSKGEGAGYTITFGKQTSSTDAATVSDGVSRDNNSTISQSRTKQAINNQGMDAAIKEAVSAKESFGAAKAKVSSFSMTSSQDVYEVQQMIKQLDSKEFKTAEELHQAATGMNARLDGLKNQAKNSGLVGPDGAVAPGIQTQSRETTAAGRAASTVPGAVHGAPLAVKPAGAVEAKVAAVQTDVAADQSAKQAHVNQQRQRIAAKHASTPDTTGDVPLTGVATGIVNDESPLDAARNRMK